MIKFIYNDLQVSNPLKDAVNFVLNTQTQHLTEQLTKLYGNNSCTIHPNTTSLVEVNPVKQEKIDYVIMSNCCEKFKREIEAMLDNTALKNL